MFLCNIIDKLLDEYGFSDSGTAKQTDFTSFKVGFQKINDLYTG
jgi:hypothetical protein